MKRREFIKAATFSGIGLLILRNPKSAWSYQANNKLNMAFVGAGGQGGGLVGTFSGLGENIVALCDVDDQRAAETYKRFPTPKSSKTSAKCWMRWQTKLMPLSLRPLTTPTLLLLLRR